MQTTAQTQATGTGSVVIDWARVRPSEEVSAAQTMDALLQWILSFAKRSDIHVVLPSARKSLETRRFQNKLMSLGCRVTTRIA
ncbi:MAG: hypothetical protein Q7R81_00105 [Candidatus Peregrinibacteria bacterium]|nr:hypothetical protein [Candidatus Peregrinibacteria bacterium]